MKVIKRVAVPTMVIAAFFAMALSAPVVVQATDRLIKITMLEPETLRGGDCGNPDDPITNPPEFGPLPPELIGHRGYTQECTPDDPENDPFGEGTWEIATNRWLPGTVVVNMGDRVTLEFFGVRGRDHITQVFRPGYDIVIRPDSLEGVSGKGYPNCVFTDTGLPVPLGPNGQQCFFVIPKGEIMRVSLKAKEGAGHIHCHTHGTSMNADLIALDNDDDDDDD